MDEDYNEGVYANEKTASDWIGWVENIASNDVRYKEIYPYLSGWIQKNKPGKILEIGSGQGECSGKVNIHNAVYIGVEPSKYLRERAQELYVARSFIAGKAELLPISDESVDAAFSVFVWFHIADLEKASAELARVLKSGGVFTIVTANPSMYDLWISWHDNVVIDGKRLTGDMGRISGDVMYLYTLEEIKNSLIKSGLEVTEIIECGYENERKIGPGFAIIISGKK